MKKIIKNTIFTIFSLSYLLMGANTALAGYPSILSTIGTPEIYSINLNVNINPNGYTTTAWFEYGTMPNLSISIQTPHFAVGATNYSSYFSQNITNLTPNTKYYFRAIADNGQYTNHGDIFSATTREAPLPVIVPPLIIHYTPEEKIKKETPKIKELKVIENTDTPKDNTDIKNLNNLSEQNNNKLSANAIFGLNFFPRTLIGWSMIVLIILVILLIVRKHLNLKENKHE